MRPSSSPHPSILKVLWASSIYICTFGGTNMCKPDHHVEQQSALLRIQTSGPSTRFKDAPPQVAPNFPSPFSESAPPAMLGIKSRSLTQTRGYVHYCSFHSPFLVAPPASNSQDLKNSVRQTCRLSYWLNYSKWQNFRCSNRVDVGLNFL